MGRRRGKGLCRVVELKEIDRESVTEPPDVDDHDYQPTALISPDGFARSQIAIR